MVLWNLIQWLGLPLHINFAFAYNCHTWLERSLE